MSIFWGFGSENLGNSLNVSALLQLGQCEEKGEKRLIQVPAEMHVTRISLIVDKCSHFCPFRCTKYLMLHNNITFCYCFTLFFHPVILSVFSLTKLSMLHKQHQNIVHNSWDFMLQWQLSRLRWFEPIGRIFRTRIEKH